MYTTFTKLVHHRKRIKLYRTLKNFNNLYKTLHNKRYTSFFKYIENLHTFYTTSTKAHYIFQQNLTQVYNILQIQICTKNSTNSTKQTTRFNLYKSLHNYTALHKTLQTTYETFTNKSVHTLYTTLQHYSKPYTTLRDLPKPFKRLQKLYLHQCTSPRNLT